MHQQIRLLQRMVAVPQLLALILVIDVAAYFGGLLYWYGPVMANPATPAWAWPFIPDCPLFGLLGGLGLMTASARRWWSEDARRRAQRSLWIAAFASVLIWLSAYLPGAPAGWAEMAAMWAVWSGALLAGAMWFRQAPAWLLGIFAFGQIKYGIWTITAWLLYWRSTAALLGAPHFSFDSVFMTITHIGLLAQGILLLTYFRPTVAAAAAALIWFGLSDFMDYGLGFYPSIPEQFIPLAVMEWSTVAVTAFLSALYLVLGLRRGQPSGGSQEAGGPEVERASQYA
ncbi:MAG TPA: DUF1405 domain-containing protein [Caldilineaceae bacterium]|nr:DUF1405 domain-containing protein [Caldilineaceae bacterium]